MMSVIMVWLFVLDLYLLVKHGPIHPECLSVHFCVPGESQSQPSCAKSFVVNINNLSLNTRPLSANEHKLSYSSVTSYTESRVFPESCNIFSSDMYTLSSGIPPM